MNSKAIQKQIIAQNAGRIRYDQFRPTPAEKKYLRRSMVASGIPMRGNSH